MSDEDSRRSGSVRIRSRFDNRLKRVFFDCRDLHGNRARTHPTLLAYFLQQQVKNTHYCRRSIIRKMSENVFNSFGNQLHCKRFAADRNAHKTNGRWTVETRQSTVVPGRR